MIWKYYDNFLIILFKFTYTKYDLMQSGSQHRVGNAINGPFEMYFFLI